MSRRKRFTGHRDHMGRYIVGMRETPPPGMTNDDDNAAASISLRKPPSSVPQNAAEPTAPKDVPLATDYPFGRGGVYEIPVKPFRRPR